MVALPRVPLLVVLRPIASFLTFRFAVFVTSTHHGDQLFSLVLILGITRFLGLLYGLAMILGFDIL